MDLGIGGRSALVFGGSRGIGRAVANVLAAEGANVAVCARKGWAARRVAAEAAERGRVKALGYALEAWDETSAAAQAERIARDFGAIDILFGIVRHTLREDGQSNPGAPTWSARLDDGFLRFRALTEALLPGMRRRRWGRVLWMVPWPEARNSAEESVRAATGAAFTAWLRCVAAEVARDGVTLNVLTPPPFWRRAAPAGRVRPEAGGVRRSPGRIPKTETRPWHVKSYPPGRSPRRRPSSSATARGGSAAGLSSLAPPWRRAVIRTFPAAVTGRRVSNPAPAPSWRSPAGARTRRR